MKKQGNSSNQATVPIIFIKRGQRVHAYSPVLDLSAMGNSVDGATKQFEDAVLSFYEINKFHGILEKTLRSCGWRKNSRKKIGFEPPEVIGFRTMDIKMPPMSKNTRKISKRNRK